MPICCHLHYGVEVAESECERCVYAATRRVKVFPVEVGSQNLCQPGILALSYLAAGSCCSLTQCLTSIRGLAVGGSCVLESQAAVQSPVECEMCMCSLSCGELWCAYNRLLPEVTTGA